MRRSALVPLLTAVFLFMIPTAHAATVTVPGDFPTLQAAIDSLEFYPEIDTIYVSPGVVEDSVYAIIQSELAIIGLGDSLTRPRIGMRAGGSSYWLLALTNLHLSDEFQTVGKANVLFESCRIEGGLRSPIQGSLRNLEFRHCIVTSRMIFGSDSFVNIDSCTFEGGTVRKEKEGALTVLHSTFHGPSPLVAIDGYDDARLEVEDVRIAGYAYGILHSGETGSLLARSNHIENCDFGIASYTEGSITGNTIVGSVQDGLLCSNLGNSGGLGIRVEQNVILGSGGRGMSFEIGQQLTRFEVVSNTSAGNDAAGLELRFSGKTDLSSATFTNNIGYGNREGLRVSGDTTGLQIACNDWFANDSAAVVGVAPSPTDVFVDPRFCDLAQDDVRLMNDSPLVNASGCGLIGARGPGCASTPTLVTLFTAERDAEGVRVRWQLADPTRLAEVWVERADVASGPWALAATELTTDGGASVALDRNALADREYWYRLVAREGTEVVVVSEPVSVQGRVAHGFELTRVTPNPGFGPLSISFTLAREAVVDLDVLDLQGRQVSALVHGSRAAGEHTVQWTGQSSAPGIYFLRYSYPGGLQVERIVRLR